MSEGLSNIKQPYGQKDGKLVSIDEVESGLKCNCICPACKSKLIARKGSEKQHHFAHHNSEDCGRGIETAIHRLAKEIIANAKSFKTPPLKLTPEVVIFEAIDIHIDNVKLEKRIDNIVPDIIIESGGKELLVEITVTHPLCFPKTRTIKEKGLATIEIKAQDLYNRLYQEGDFFLRNKAFKEELISGTELKSWAYNSKREVVELGLKSKYAKRKDRKSYKLEEYEYLNYVEDCPAARRVWKSGYKKGKPYARIDEDCQFCKYCVGIDYKEWIDPKLEFHRHSYPVTAYCIADYTNKELQNIVLELR